MSHTFLLQSGSWILRGSWFEGNQKSLTVTGATIVTWNQSSWFTVKTKLLFSGGEHPEITYEYKGHLLSQNLQYSYVLNHSDLGQIEGEGWLGNDSIIHHYWVLGDARRRTGFETLLYLDDNTYHLSGGMMAGNHLLSTVEAILERQ